MKKISIVIICLFLLSSAVNFGTSKPTLLNDLASEIDYSIDNSVIGNAQEQQILQNINRLDGFFTENRGQVRNDSVRYYIQGKGVWFLDDGVVFEIQEPVEQTEVQRNPIDKFHLEFEPEMPSSRKSVVLKLNFEGCNEVEPKGVGLLSHKNNYFYGNDSSKWCSNVPNYYEINYENIYDNIDLRYYSNEKGLKYDFIVHPRGDLNDIKLRYDGAQTLQVDSSRDLILNTPFGNIIDAEPFIYQNNNEIYGSFKLFDILTYGFELIGEYDKNQDLIIDPLIYSTYIGGSNDEEGHGIGIDSSGNAYVAGFTHSSNFPNTTGAYDPIHNWVDDIFVFKLDPTGSSLIYSTFVGGNSYEHCYGHSLAIDSSGNAYVTGHTKSTDFPNTTGAYDTSYNGGGEDVFVFKLNQTGSKLLYSTFVGGSNLEWGWAISIDSSNNVYLTGKTGSADFPNTTGAYDTTFNGGSNDVFVAKFNLSGNGAKDLVYSTFIGGSNIEEGSAIQIDSSGNAYVTGVTRSFDFPNTTGAYDTTLKGPWDSFIFKLNSAGSSLIYSTFLGGSGGETSKGIAVDSSGNAYITGRTNSSDFPTTTGAYNTTYNNNWDIFILKLNSTGSSLMYSTFAGGGNYDISYGIALDSSGNAHVTGYTGSADFPNTTDAYDSTYNGDGDTFVLELDSTGALLLYSTFIGGSSWERGYGIAIDTSCNAYITGITNSLDFPNTTGANDTTHNGWQDVFVLKLNLPPKFPPTVVNLNISKSFITRTNLIYLYSNGTDIEDIEKNFTPYFEYRGPHEQVWNSTFFSTPQYNNSRWEISFTPPKNATLGLYDFRVKFNDTGGLFSNWFYLNDSLMVLNNVPLVENLFLSNNTAILGDTISIWLNGSDIEELEENLTVALEYQDPSETSWDKTDLSTPTYNNGRWEYSFNMPFDALFGYYDFRARCNDSDGNYSEWVYLNDSLLVYNTGPKVIDAKLSEISIYRTESVYLFINGSDYETPEGMLSFYVQFKPQSEDEWTNLTGNYLNNTWEVGFVTKKESMIGMYDFRTKFEDNETLSTGWVYLNDSLKILNNPPIISEDLDDITIGIQPLIIDLTLYESDIEDTDVNLTWSIEPQTYTYIKSIEIIDIINDTLKITPKENVTGTEDIELTLTDKDSGTAVKSDIKIIVDSTISEFTPKVTLLSPPDKTTVNTLIPTLKWKLEYSGTDLITYSVILDENPEPLTEVITDLTTTSYKLEYELEDGKTYYWKVIPKNGICLSNLFRFTIDLSFEPIYKVNLTSEKNHIMIKQGVAAEINLTVKNEGNVNDNFRIEYSSAKLQLQVSIDKTNVQLTPEITSNLKLSVTIPEGFELGDYFVKVTATSLSEVIVKDEVTIDVKVVSKDFEPDYNVSISVAPTSLNLIQGDSENVTITITNDGNIEDDFTIRFESGDFTSADIRFSNVSLSLREGDSDTIRVSIKIPEDIEPGVYTIKFIVESNDDPKESTLTIIVKDKDSEEPKTGDEDNTMLYAVIGIIVVIIVVLILLFIFLKKKKGEEEPPVEEAMAPAPDEVPPEVPPEQPPTPEVPPEQVPSPETPPPEQPQVPEVPPEQPPTPEVTPQVVPQVEPAPEPAPIPQVEEQPPQPQVVAQAPVPNVMKTEQQVEPSLPKIEDTEE